MSQPAESTINLYSSDEAVPGEHAAALERVSQCLVKIYQNVPIDDIHTLVDDLMLFSRPPKGAAGEKSDWLLKSSANGEVGQTLIYQKQAEAPQEILLSLDAKGNPYLGSWRSLKPGEENLGFMFHLEPSGSEAQLVIEDGRNKKQLLLKHLPGSAGWVSLAGFLEGLKALVESEDIPPEPELRTARATQMPPRSMQASQAPAPPSPPPTPVTPAPKPEPLPTPATIVAKAPTWHVVVQPGGQTIALAGSLSIGRERDNDLCLEDKKLSRHHAVIESAAKGWQVRDLGSTNGSGVNGKRISAPLLLKAGDVIELGDTRLTLELR